MTSPAVERDDPPKADEAPGWEAETAFVERDPTLPAGTRLRDYEIRSCLAASDFGVVYQAWDHSLQRPVAIREYLPRPLAARIRGATGIEIHPGSTERYALGLGAFVAEARLLARFDHPALVKVYRFWEENGTAYMAMPYCEGPTLERALADRTHPQDEAEARSWLRPIVDALSLMHAAHCQHLDIGPDSIVLTAGGPVLLGFAAARRLLVGAGDGAAAAVKPGYAAIEQYGDTALQPAGAWTDFYALAAVVYRAVGGREPVPAPQRVAHDPQPALATLAVGRASTRFLEAMDAALAVEPRHRPRSDVEFRELAGGMDAALPTLPIGPPRDLMAEPFGLTDDNDREITVPLPTQPWPAPAATDDPMLRPFLMPVHEAPAVLPFAREEFRPTRRAMVAIAVGVALLGGVAAAMLRYYAAGDRAVAATAAPPLAAAPIRNATPQAVAAPTAAVVPAPAMPPAPTASAVVGPVAQAAAPRRFPVENRPADAAARRTLCGDLMQEATLRRLAADEAAFYRKECR